MALYDGQPVPKVIDFGVAKATAAKLTEKTMFTHYGEVVGTLEYMSPEQANLNQLDIDTRSDIYSLGVLLYELLTGATPFDKERLRSAAFEEMLRIIREDEPPRPSLRLSTIDTLPSVAANRKIEPKKLGTLIRGDLDWIVVKALEKDRARRYETATGLANDIQRYLSDEAVVACPPSLRYRVRKFARRNRRSLVLISALALAAFISIFAVAGSIGWVVRDQTARQARVAGQVQLILDETQRLMREQKWRDASANARRAETLAASIASHPVARQADRVVDDLALVRHLAEARLTLVQVRANQFDYRAAEAAHAQAFARSGIAIDQLTVEDAASKLAVRRPILSALAEGLGSWSALHRKIESETDTWRHLLAVADAIDPDPWRRRLRAAWRDQEESNTLAEMAEAAPLDSLPPGSIVLLAEALASQVGEQVAVDFLLRAHPHHPGDLWVNLELANHLYQSDPRAAEMYVRVALAIRPDNPALLNNVGYGVHERGQLPQAAAYYRKALQFDPTFAYAYHNLANVAKDQGDFRSAADLYRKAIKFNAAYAPAHHNLAMALKQLGELPEAIAEFNECIRRAPEWALPHFSLGCTLGDGGRLDDAVSHLRSAIDLEPSFAAAHARLGILLAEQDRPQEACECFKKTIQHDEKRIEAYCNLGIMLQQLGRADEAIDWLHKGIEAVPTFAGAHYTLANIYDESGQVEPAITHYRQAIAIEPNHAEARGNVSILLTRSGQVEEAVEHARKAAHLRPHDPRARELLVSTLLQYGNWLAQRDDLATAAGVYREVLQLEPQCVSALNGLAGLLTHVGRGSDPHEAVELAREVTRLRSGEWQGWHTLGVAHYRAGSWGEAIEALKRSMELHADGNPADWFFLAMCYWQLDRRDEAHRWYDQAIEWMEKNQSADERLRSTRAEAAGLLQKPQ